MEMQAYSKKIEIENQFMSNALCSVGAAEKSKADTHSRRSINEKIGSSLGISQ